MPENHQPIARQRTLIVRAGVIAAVIAILSVSAFATYYWQHRFIRAAEAAITEGAKDPSSVVFKDVADCPNKGWVTGKLNAKNAFGAYVGFKHFYSNAADSFIDSEGRSTGLGRYDDDIKNYGDLAEYSKNCGDGMYKFYIGLTAKLIERKYYDEDNR